MLRNELIVQLRRPRGLVLLLLLAGLPAIAAATTAGGHGADTRSALNFATSGLNFMDPVLFGVIVALLGAYAGGSDREWGTLRYLLIRPVPPRRLLAGKWLALVVCVALVVAVFVVVAVLSGYVVFGWHDYQRTGAGDLAGPEAVLALLGASGYLFVCLVSVGSVALALGMLLPRSVEALAVSGAFVLGSAMIEGVQSLHPLVVTLPVHYWLRWNGLFTGDGNSLVIGVAVQLAWIAAALAATQFMGRRDPVG